ncbi:MAG TPA: glycosyltransferase, partial [Candidatus Limnocylindria bacterium]|nr:glycosyltransferase [Candidatus Limnocylindria bacterium]
ILSLLAVIFGTLASTVNFQTAFLFGKTETGAAGQFVRRTLKVIWLAAGLISLVWILFIPSFANFFNVSNLRLVFLFTPVFAFGAIAAVLGGYLRGTFNFKQLGTVTIIEAFAKLGFAFGLVYFGLHSWASASIPASIVVSYFLMQWYVWKIFKHKKEYSQTEANVQTVFPSAYFWASLTNGVAGAAFLNLDVLLAKHYFDPSVAGAYALLSLVGKMVYFFGSLLSAFVTSIVSKHRGAGTNPNKDFYRLFNGAIFFTGVAFIGAGVLGKYTIPILLGHSSLAIIPNLFDYCLAMAMFTLSATVISYHLAKREYSFAGITLASAILLVTGIIKYHSSINAFTNVMLTAAIFNFAIIFIWHAIKKNTRFVLRNISDFLDVFMPLPKAAGLPDGQKILIFNWRDTKHVFAGGAENYIHELSKRWVEAGNQVTLFCGNDGMNKRNELVDGVNVIRRGGFYFVYLWAFVYYMVKFRGQYDIIIDSQNGVPFFTPLYAKEPVFCLMHHVHQEVFHKYLSWPLAKLAAFLEKTAMPFVYRHTKFITVSNSSLKEMQNIGLGLAGTEVVFPGVDLQTLQPGQRAEHPTILYLGRLKAYKSVDVLIKAFKSIVQKIPQARLVIAGGGEHEGTLRTLAKKLKLEHFIDFRGKVDDDEKVSLFQQAWVFVNPSLMEGWGITVIEANACGAPVVAANVPGLRDSVQNPHTGYLVEHGNVEKFSQRISELIENQELHAQMRQDAIDWAKNFDWDKSSQKFLDLLKEAQEPPFTGFFAENKSPNIETNFEKQ